MNSEIRQKIFDKYGGRCAYCGCELKDGWHVDEIEPVRRRNKTIPAGWYKNGVAVPKTDWQYLSEQDIVDAGLAWKDARHVFDRYDHPERLTIENQNPACASCNINKHSESLENFRASIKKYVESLNLYSTQYKIAKRYGLVAETNAEVKFYFELLNTEQNPDECDATKMSKGQNAGPKTGNQKT